MNNMYLSLSFVTVAFKGKSEDTLRSRDIILCKDLVLVRLNRYSLQTIVASLKLTAQVCACQNNMHETIVKCFVNECNWTAELRFHSNYDPYDWRRNCVISST